jgi:uncharacterized protein (UPF0147 family)
MSVEINETRGFIMAKKSQSSEANGKTAAKTSDAVENTSAYFRAIFKKNPKLLTSRSNDELLKRWLADHPGETEVPKNVKANVSNLKSVLRSKGRKKAVKAVKVAVAAPVGTTPAPHPAPARTQLEKLEEQIDDCLTFARHLDREGLEDVILHLRKARNAVVWKMGS